MPNVLFDILDVAGAILRLIGLLVFGLGLGWFALDAYRKENWQLQIAVFLGFVFTAVGFAEFLSAGSLGMFTLGAGGALLMWGMSKDKKKNKDED